MYQHEQGYPTYPEWPKNYNYRYPSDRPYAPAWLTPQPMSGWEILKGFIAVFIAIPLLFGGLILLVLLVILAITVPPVGIALLTRG